MYDAPQSWSKFQLFTNMTCFAPLHSLHFANPAKPVGELVTDLELHSGVV